jgi:putative membrane protein
MLSVAVVLVVLAALVHVYIFVIESLQFERPSTLRAFGIKPEEAAYMKPWAFNQGFYNLFLAIGAGAGAGLLAADRHPGGFALALFTTASMLAAALVLVGSDRRKLRGAVVQGTFPLLAVVALLVWCLR